MYFSHENFSIYGTSCVYTYVYMYNVLVYTVATGNSISSHEYYASESLLNDLNKTLIITMLCVGCMRSLNLHVHVTTRLSVENNDPLN